MLTPTSERESIIFCRIPNNIYFPKYPHSTSIRSRSHGHPLDSSNDNAAHHPISPFLQWIQTNPLRYYLPTDGQMAKGKLIHVVGNPATGFALEFKRNYDFEQTSRGFRHIPLAQVNDQHVRDTDSGGRVLGHYCLGPVGICCNHVPAAWAQS